VEFVHRDRQRQPGDGAAEAGVRRAAEADATRLARLIAEIAVEFRERGAGWTTAVEGLTAAVVALTAAAARVKLAGPGARL
jgi:hypothetical protein